LSIDMRRNTTDTVIRHRWPRDMYPHCDTKWCKLDGKTAEDGL